MFSVEQHEAGLPGKEWLCSSVITLLRPDIWQITTKFPLYKVYTECKSLLRSTALIFNSISFRCSFSYPQDWQFYLITHAHTHTHTHTQSSEYFHEMRKFLFDSILVWSKALLFTQTFHYLLLTTQNSPIIVTIHLHSCILLILKNSWLERQSFNQSFTLLFKHHNKIYTSLTHQTCLFCLNM